MTKEGMSDSELQELGREIRADIAAGQARDAQHDAEFQAELRENTRRLREEHARRWAEEDARYEAGRAEILSRPLGAKKIAKMAGIVFVKTMAIPAGIIIGQMIGDARRGEPAPEQKPAPAATASAKPAPAPT